MARPQKLRQLCSLPNNDKFIPYNSCNNCKNANNKEVTLTLDQYEVIRLIDYEGLNQEECSKQMNVARTTVQLIYDEARKKLAKSLVEGKSLIIGGGNVIVCDKDGLDCLTCKKECPNRIIKNVNIKEVNKMKIAVTYENGNVFQHFGHTEAFKIYDVEEENVKDSHVVMTNGTGHGALAGFLKELGVEVLICGGIGGGAQQALANVGIMIYGGVTGDCDKAVSDLIANCLDYNPDVKCNHHEHHDGDNCGHENGGCSHHSCHN